MELTDVPRFKDSLELLLNTAEDLLDMFSKDEPLLDTGSRHMLKLHALRNMLREVRNTGSEYRQVAKMLIDQEPIASHFRDGSRAPAVVSTRQYIYLANLVGYVEPTQCHGTTKLGQRCKGWAKRDELYCSQHIPKQESA